MKTPTSQQIEEAKQYLRRRLDASNIAEERCNDYFHEAAVKIALIVMRYRKQGKRIHVRGSGRCAIEIQNVVDWLLDMILETCTELSIPEEYQDDDDRKDAVLVHVLEEEYYGATFDERMDADRVILLTALEKAIVFDNMDISHEDEDDMVEFIESSTKGVNRRLVLLAITTIGAAYNYSMMLDAEKSGMSGFYVINGSAPCKFCASMEGFHKMDDPIPLYHPNCVCCLVFV